MNKKGPDNNDNASSAETSPSSDKSPSRANPLYAIIFISILGCNVYSIHRFNYSVVSWWTYFSIPLIIGACIALGLLIITLIHKKLSQENVAVYSLLTFGLPLWYCVFFSCIPFWINSLFINEITETSIQEYVESEFERYDDMNNYLGTSYDISIDYKGHSFEKTRSSSNDIHEIVVYSGIGLFGWEYIQDIKIY